MRSAQILIAGGGIGGLAAALALTQRGLEVSVYEQAAELHEFGAGIAITPNGSRVMTELGLRPLIEEIASSPRHRAMRLFTTGQTWQLPATDALGPLGWCIVVTCVRCWLTRWNSVPLEPSASVPAVWGCGRIQAEFRSCWTMANASGATH